MKHILQVGLIGVFTLSVASCGNDLAAPEYEAALLSIAPSGGTTGVNLDTSISIEFSHPMQDEAFVAVHEASMSGPFGPLVDGTMSWEQDELHLVFTPNAPLMPQTEYTIHIGGGMMDQGGHVIDLEQHGVQMGGQWVMQTVMQDCMMNVCGSMMGPGWQHTNGSYGMSFTFTTR
jgi:hypothetical protein